MTVKTEKEKERLSLFEHSWDVPGNVQVCVCVCVDGTTGTVRGGVVEEEAEIGGG